MKLNTTTVLIGAGALYLLWRAKRSGALAQLVGGSAPAASQGNGTVAQAPVSAVPGFEVISV